MNKTAADGFPLGEGAEPRAPSLDDPLAVAAYVAALSEELARLARASGLVTLAYILDMARLEARGEVSLRTGDGAPGEIR